MVVVPPEVHAHEHLDDVHVHLLPKYQSYAVHMCKKCQGHGSDNKALG